MSRSRHPPAWFVRWYMGRVAGRYCPCEWPVRVKWLIRLCARLDDENARLDFIRFAAFHMPSTVTTTASTQNVAITYTRKRHSD